MALPIIRLILWPCELGNKTLFVVFASVSLYYQVLIFPMRNRVTENTGFGAKDISMIPSLVSHASH